MNTDFKDAMAKQSDAELIKIITVARNDYQPLAVEAAEEEIKKRGINTTTIEQVKTDLTIKIEDEKQFDEKQAGPMLRFINFIVDTLVFLIIGVILSFIVSFVLAQFNVVIYQVMLPIFSLMTLSTGFLGYYVFMETKYQKTFGKIITGTIVVKRDGTKANAGEILIRSLCRFIPFDRVSYIFMKNGFHDRLSNTTVIKEEN